MNQPLVSVILPVYNGAKFVELGIRSLLDSNYENFEILVGDDGSTDETWDVLQKFSDNPKIRLFRLSHKGAGSVRNELISKVNGEYVAFQDADDKSDPTRFIKQIKTFSSNPEIDAVGTDSVLIDQSGIKWGEIRVNERPSRLDWYCQRSVVHASLMIRKSAMSGCFYSEKMSIGEDYYFLTCLFLKGKVFVNLKESLYQYNVNKENLRSRAFIQYFQVMKAKVIISRLFPFPQNMMFILLNFFILSLSAIRGFFIQISHRN